MVRVLKVLLLVVGASAYQQPGPVFSRAWIQKNAVAPLCAACLSGMVLIQPAVASTAAPEATSTTAAQISLNSIPPSSISVQIKDLPVIGKLASGVYSRGPDSTKISKPSIVIQSPADKTKAIQDIVTSGHLEFDVSGVIKTHLDIDVAAEKAGEMRIRIASNLIPKLPFQNAASFAKSGSPTGGKESPWNMVQNMGSGSTYYYNEKTGVTQYEKPVL